MESYKIEWKRSAAKELKQLPKETVGKIVTATENLSSNPFPHQTKKLVGSESSFRIRVGDYRIVYTIFARTLTIEIVRIKHRREVYK